MQYKLDISDEVDRKFRKLKKRGKELLEIVGKKIQQILENPYHFKPLRGDMYGARRVHIGSFVLIYEVLESEKAVRLLDFDHHDKVY